MMYGHVDTPAHWVAHLRALAAHPGRDRRLHRVRAAAVRAPQLADLPGRGRPARARRVRENRAVHAMARLLLHGRIDNIQTLLGEARRRPAPRPCCSGGVNDLGGTLMEETISRMAGSENGSLKTIAELEAMAAAIGRPGPSAHHGVRHAVRRAPGHRPLRRGPPPAHPVDHAVLTVDVRRRPEAPPADLRQHAGRVVEPRRPPGRAGTRAARPPHRSLRRPGAIPAFVPGEQPAPASVHDLLGRITRAGAVLISTPEYAGSLPGSMKNLPTGRSAAASSTTSGRLARRCQPRSRWWRPRSAPGRARLRGRAHRRGGVRARRRRSHRRADVGARG